MNSTKEFLAVEWRNGFNPIGFVLFRDRITEKYIVRCDKISGINQVEDIEHIRDFGWSLSYREAFGFFNYLRSEEYETT